MKPSSWWTHNVENVLNRAMMQDFVVIVPTICLKSRLRRTQNILLLVFRYLNE